MAITSQPYVSLSHGMMIDVSSPPEYARTTFFGFALFVTGRTAASFTADSSGAAPWPFPACAPLWPCLRFVLCINCLVAIKFLF